jgi:hypothetical protein
MSVIQKKKKKPGWARPSREGTNWDQAASQAFGVPMKVTGERKVAGHDNVLTCEPNYDDPVVGTTSADFKRRPTGLIFPVVIQLSLGYRSIQMKVASNAPPSSVEARFRIQFGQNPEFSAPKPITLTTNKTHKMQKTYMRLLDMVPEVNVAITMVVGNERTREENILIPQTASGKRIVSAWWRVVDSRNLTNPRLLPLMREDSWYEIHDDNLCPMPHRI